MSTSRQSIFREMTRDKSTQRQDASALLHFISPSRMAVLWILLCLLFILLGNLWFLRVPIYVFSPGLLLERQQAENKPGDHTLVALLFVPADHVRSPQISPGMHIQLQPDTHLLTSSTHQEVLIATIERVETKALTPEEIQNRYHFEPALVLNGPSVLVFAKIATSDAKTHAGGSSVQARIQIGTTPVIALLSGSN